MTWRHGQSHAVLAMNNMFVGVANMFVGVGDDTPAWHAQVFAMNNMFVSLLIYLTVRLQQQKSRRLTLARAGAFAIGQSCASFLPLPPLLFCVVCSCQQLALHAGLPRCMLTRVGEMHVCVGVTRVTR